jgi:hypothetical protein
MKNRPKAAPTPALTYVLLMPRSSPGVDEVLADAAVIVVPEAVGDWTEVGEMLALPRASALVSAPLSGLLQFSWMLL